MSRHRFIAALIAVVFAGSPITASVADKQIKDVNELAGTWQGWVNTQLASDERVLMTIKPDGTYRATSTADGGTLTGGQYYLDGGTLKYRSSRTEGTAVVSENNGKRTLTLKPQGFYNPNTGPAVYERVK